MLNKACPVAQSFLVFQLFFICLWITLVGMHLGGKFQISTDRRFHLSWWDQQCARSCSRRASNQRLTYELVHELAFYIDFRCSNMCSHTSHSIMPNSVVSTSLTNMKAYLPWTAMDMGFIELCFLDSVPSLCHIRRGSPVCWSRRIKEAHACVVI